MSTDITLRKAGYDNYVGPLGPNQLQYRQLWLHLRLQSWIREALPLLRPDHGSSAPLAQFVELLNRYVVGEHLEIGDGRSLLHVMRPANLGIWELTPVDVRIFGWFLARDVFIATNANEARRIKDWNLYAGFRDESVRERDALHLPNPKFISSTEYDDVLSDRRRS